MNEATLDLARRAVASPHWRWMPGMLVMSDPEAVPRPYLMRLPELSPLRARVFSVQLGTWYGAGEYDVDNPDWEGEQCGGNDLPGTLPDLTDPVTVEAVGILAREAWGADSIDVRVDIATRMEGVVASWTARALRMHRLGSGTVRCVDVDVRVACYVDAVLSAPPREVE